VPITAFAYFQDIDRIATGNAAGAIEVWNHPEAFKYPKAPPLLVIQPPADLPSVARYVGPSGYALAQYWITARAVDPDCPDPPI